MSWASISREAEKTSKKKIALVPPGEGVRKNRNFGRVPGTRGQGTGTSWVSYQPDPTKIDPDPASSVAQIRPRWPKMLRSRFWLQKKDLGASVGAIGMVFRDLSGRSRPDSKNPQKSCLSSPAYSLRAPLWQTPISPTKGRPPYRFWTAAKPNPMSYTHPCTVSSNWLIWNSSTEKCSVIFAQKRTHLFKQCAQRAELLSVLRTGNHTSSCTPSSIA